MIPIPVLIILLLLIVIFMLLGTLRKHDDLDRTIDRIQFKSRPIMTAMEQAFYYRLRDAFPDDLVFSQVGLKQIITPKLQGKNRRVVMNKIDKMHCDFVICGRDSKILAVIELEDKKKKDPLKRQKIARKNRILSAAGIRFVQYDLQGMPSIEALRSYIFFTAPHSTLSKF